jgi:hypothetical protein
MSRPGFVFDLVTSVPDYKLSYVCRSCGAERSGEAESDARLHAAMREHLRDQHGLADSSGWRITHHERSREEAAVCFWPPEAE